MSQTSERPQVASGQVGNRWISLFAISWLGIWLAQLTPFPLTLPEQVMGILADQPRSATVTAEVPTTALRIDRRVFLELLSQFPQIAIAVMRELAHRLEMTNQQLAQMRTG